MRWTVRITALLMTLAAAEGALHAEMAYLRNGRTIEVSGYTIDGETITLRIASGGEIALPVKDILEIRRQPAEAPPPPIAAPPESVPAPVSPPPAAEALPKNPVAPAAADAEPPLLRVGGVFDSAALKDMAARIARRHGVDEALVHAVIQVESRYDAFAVSPRGAMGLMQLMPKTAARFEVENAFDPVQNVDAGVRYLKELLERYSGQARLALAAYNAGEDAVERYRGIPPYRETIEYVRRIQRILRH